MHLYIIIWSKCVCIWNCTCLLHYNLVWILIYCLWFILSSHCNMSVICCSKIKPFWHTSCSHYWSDILRENFQKGYHMKDSNSCKNCLHKVLFIYIQFLEISIHISRFETLNRFQCVIYCISYLLIIITF